MKRISISRSSLTTLIAFSTLLLFALSFAAPAHAAGEVNNCSDDSAFNTVMLGGGTVTFNCGGNNHTASIMLSKTYTISTNTTIDGDNSKVTLDGTNSRRLFIVNNGVSLNLKNIILANGYSNSGNGGTILNNGFLALDHMTIQHAGDSNDDGGAVYTTGGVDITNSTFVNDIAGRGGVIAASGSGAQVSISQSVMHDDSVASNVSGKNRGGAIYLESGANVQIFSSDIYSNAAGYGGAIYNDSATLSVTNSTLRFNNARTANGGAIANFGTATLTSDTLSQNTAPNGFGGAIYNASTMTMDKNSVANNSAEIGGGIDNVYHGKLTVTNSMFTGNQQTLSSNGGAAIDNNNGNEISSNSDPNAATLTLSNSTFWNNTAAGGGAGIENAFEAHATLTNVTFSGNTVTDQFGGGGAGLYNFESTANLTNVTFSNNVGNIGSGIYNTNYLSTTLTLKNVLLNNNTTGGNCKFDKAPNSSVFNLSSDGTCGFGSGRDNVKPKLLQLGTNGDTLVGAEMLPLLTQALTPGSKAIDDGTTNGCPGTDERNVARFFGHSCEVGAIEFVPCPSAPSKPNLLFPAKNAIITTPQVALDWAGPDCAKTFNVVVRKGSNKGAVVFSKTKLKLSQVTTGTLAKGKYAWQVTACAGTKCVAGAWWKFQVGEN